MLAAFGIFWTGEGLGVAWPGADLAIVVFAALFLAVALAASPWSVARVLRFCHEHAGSVFRELLGLSLTMAGSPWRFWRSSCLPAFSAALIQATHWHWSHLAVRLSRSAFANWQSPASGPEWIITTSRVTALTVRVGVLSQQFTSIIDICEYDASAVATLQPEAEVQS